MASLYSSKGHKAFYHATQGDVVESLHVDNKGLITVSKIPVEGEVTALCSCSGILPAVLPLTLCRTLVGGPEEWTGVDIRST
jgi:hypothetical protein